MSRPKTLAERLDWMAKNLLGFAEELEAVAWTEHVAARRTPALSNSQLSSAAPSVTNEADSHSTSSPKEQHGHLIEVAPEDQEKTFTLTYSEYCLLIEVVARHTDTTQAPVWRRLSRSLGLNASADLDATPDQNPTHFSKN